MEIRSAIAGVGLALAMVCVTPVEANASPDSIRAEVGASRAQGTLAGAPLPVPTVAKMIKLDRPDVTPLAWECPGGHSCYYDGYNGTYRFWVAPTPGFFNLGRFNPPQNDKLTSILNGGGGTIDLYNWVGHWDYKGTVARGDWGNLPPELNNIIDAVRIN